MNVANYENSNKYSRYLQIDHHFRIVSSNNQSLGVLIHFEALPVCTFSCFSTNSESAVWVWARSRCEKWLLWLLWAPWECLHFPGVWGCWKGPSEFIWICCTILRSWQGKMELMEHVFLPNDMLGHASLQGVLLMKGPLGATAWRYSLATDNDNARWDANLSSHHVTTPRCALLGLLGTQADRRRAHPQWPPWSLADLTLPKTMDHELPRKHFPSIVGITIYRVYVYHIYKYIILYIQYIHIYMLYYTYIHVHHTTIAVPLCPKKGQCFGFPCYGLCWPIDSSSERCPPPYGPRFQPLLQSPLITGWSVVVTLYNTHLTMHYGIPSGNLT